MSDFFCFYSAGDGEQGREMRTLIQVITISSISCCLRNVEFVICLLLITKAMFLSLELCDCRGCCRLCFVLAIVAFLFLQVDYRGNVFVFVIVLLSAIDLVIVVFVLSWLSMHCFSCRWITKATSLF